MDILINHKTIVVILYISFRPGNKQSIKKKILKLILSRGNRPISDSVDFLKG